MYWFAFLILTKWGFEALILDYDIHSRREVYTLNQVVYFLLKKMGKKITKGVGNAYEISTTLAPSIQEKQGKF